MGSAGISRTKTPDRIGCQPSAVIGATVGIKVGGGCGVGGMAVGLGVIVGSGVRVDSGGAASVGNGEEAALVASQADNTTTNRQHRIMAENLKRPVFIFCILLPVV
jgi:hypothetical protein